MSESPKGFKNFAQNEKSLGDFVTCDMKRGGVCGYSRCTYYIIFIYLFNDQLQYSLHGQRIIYNIGTATICKLEKFLTKKKLLIFLPKL